MKKKLIIFVGCTICIVITLTICFFFFLKSLAVNETAHAMSTKDIISNTLSFFSALATLSAAVIAAYLVNDWKEPVYFNLKIDFYHEATEYSERIDSLLYDLCDVINFSEEERFKNEYKKLHREFTSNFIKLKQEYEKLNKILDLDVPSAMYNPTHPFAVISDISSQLNHLRRECIRHKKYGFDLNIDADISKIEDKIFINKKRIDRLLGHYLLDKDLEESVKRFYYLS